MNRIVTYILSSLVLLVIIFILWSVFFQKTSGKIEVVSEDAQTSIKLVNSEKLEESLTKLGFFSPSAVGILNINSKVTVKKLKVVFSSKVEPLFKVNLQNQVISSYDLIYEPSSGLLTMRIYSNKIEGFKKKLPTSLTKRFNSTFARVVITSLYGHEALETKQDVFNKFTNPPYFFEIKE